MADGKPFLLGMENLATSVSTLVRRGGAGPALRVRVDSGPPLAVNSQEKITNLNADKVDGKDAEAFLAADGKAQDAAHADRTEWAADAQKLEGRGANEFTTGVVEFRLEGDQHQPLIPVVPERVTFGTLTVKSFAASGYLRLNGNVTFFHDLSRIVPPDPLVGPGQGWVQGLLHNVWTSGLTPSASVPSYEDITGRQYANISLDGLFDVSVGETTVEVLLTRGVEGPGVGPIYAQCGVLTAEYSFTLLPI